MDGPGAGADPATAAHNRKSVPPEDESFRVRLTEALGDAYELLDTIGQGGFGRVYKARDTRLGRIVAIKVIRPDLAGASAFLERFRREGVALARLRHPAIVPIYDIREQDGLIYYVMPFIEGDTLRQRLEVRGRMPPKVAHRVLLELCDAIVATHRAGIVHRDIKPDNVILEGRQDKVLLMDFGIAKVVDSESTQSGMIVGTPTYMSPEQLGDVYAVDERSDIYSLGVVAYHLLTGRPPFVGSSYGEVMRQHLTARPEPLRSLNPSVPLFLADIVEQCLEKDPLDRFESAAALWDQMQHVTFLRETAPGVADDRPMIGRWTAVFGGLAVLALALALFGASALSLPGRPAYLALAGGLALVGALTSPRFSAGSPREWLNKLLRRG
jgi:serine/threonine-protein kinase